MALLKCIILDCKNPAEEEIKRMSVERIQSVFHSSVKRQDKFNKQLNSLKAEGVLLAYHRSCDFSYTSQHHIVDKNAIQRKQEKEKDNSVEKIRLQSICKTFNFRKHCIFCGEESKDINPNIYADGDVIIWKRRMQLKQAKLGKYAKEPFS